MTAGVETYPRLGDRVYAAPHRFVSFIPELMNKVTDFDSKNVNKFRFSKFKYGKYNKILPENHLVAIVLF